jgi:hypothetical protein
LPKHRIDSFHVHSIWLPSVHPRDMSHYDITNEEGYEAPSEQS